MGVMLTSYHQHGCSINFQHSLPSESICLILIKLPLNRQATLETCFLLFLFPYLALSFSFSHSIFLSPACLLPLTLFHFEV